ncbi:SbmA/BacA-like family transporter [Corticibacterium sp. UT-5YL-CI-8]|nr:SbmA/BacA-like family transporter [Tianweitania sp. UT-5YL-CI-8]
MAQQDTFPLPVIDLSGKPGPWEQVRILGAMLRRSECHRRTTLFSVTLLVVIVATAYMQVVLNNWNVPFYNALEQRNLPSFIDQLQRFCWIAFVLLVLNVGQAWLSLRIALELRHGISSDLMQQWLRRDRSHSTGSEDTSYPDQRIHLDARSLADSTNGLAIGFVQSTILLVSFIGILWNVSSGFVFRFEGQAFTIPGYMVWAAFLYSGIASLMSWYVGRNLVVLSADRETREGEFRSSLKTVNDSLDKGENRRSRKEHLARLEGQLAHVLSVSWKIALSQTNLTWVSAGFGWLALVVPILVAAPIYFAGGLNFGGLMMAVGAFTQVHTAMRWYVNNFPNIAQWQANLSRVTSFRKTLTTGDLA